MDVFLLSLVVVANVITMVSLFLGAGRPRKSGNAPGSLEAIVAPAGSTVVLRSPRHLNEQQREQVQSSLKQRSEEGGVRFVLLEGEWDVRVIEGPESGTSFADQLKRAAASASPKELEDAKRAAMPYAHVPDVRSASYAAAVEQGWLSRDEARDLLGIRTDVPPAPIPRAIAVRRLAFLIGSAVKRLGTQLFGSRGS